MSISLQLPWLRDYPQHRPRLLRYRSSTWFIVLTIFMAIFTVRFGALADVLLLNC